MNEQERAIRFATEIDRLLEPAAQPVAEETTMLKDDQELLELAHTLAQMDISSQSHFLRRLRQQQGGKMQTNISPSLFQPRRLALAFGAVALILAVVMLSLPPARALANELWQSLFTRHSSDTINLSEPFVVSALPTSTPIATGEQQPATSVAEAAALAGYRVMEATYLPEGYRLSTVYHDAEQGAVTLLYLNDDWLGITLRQEPATAAMPWLIGETAVVEQVQVGEIPAEYVRGEWAQQGHLEGPFFTVEGGTWNADGPMQQLRWIDGEMAYTLATMSGWETGLDQADLIRMAESVR